MQPILRYAQPLESFNLYGRTGLSSARGNAWVREKIEWRDAAQKGTANLPYALADRTAVAQAARSSNPWTMTIHSHSLAPSAIAGFSPLNVLGSTAIGEYPTRACTARSASRSYAQTRLSLPWIITSATLPGHRLCSFITVRHLSLGPRQRHPTQRLKLNATFSHHVFR
ncbi:hypothetical protein L227DRAFT_232680 [Lentinus tigrinus ALCF2SS1-6]|uniref:Uncharacterized protein n=1 Tax=Lentinus tigrinus ALCF2SS1-6 TaxID=1328759 RepID=A0A5C2S144_9APHY|nr:hypothetical protein L227DRAFT_232680 [Lentinus tigrinus ALCF2SS1-6]